MLISQELNQAGGCLLTLFALKKHGAIRPRGPSACKDGTGSMAPGPERDAAAPSMQQPGTSALSWPQPHPQAVAQARPGCRDAAFAGWEQASRGVKNLQLLPSAPGREMQRPRSPSPCRPVRPTRGLPPRPSPHPEKHRSRGAGCSPPIRALYATPAPQIRLLATAATSPAQRVPCLSGRAGRLPQALGIPSVLPLAPAQLKEATSVLSSSRGCCLWVTLPDQPLT